MDWRLLRHNSRPPRSVKNLVVLEQVVQRLTGLDLALYHHLVITTDRKNPLNSEIPSFGFPPEFFNADGQNV